VKRKVLAIPATKPDPKSSTKASGGSSAHSTLKAFCHWEGDTLVLNVLGKPSASRDAIGQVQGSQLKIGVTAAPQDGRATDHMVRFLAGEFGVARGSIEVVFGRQNVNKQLRIASPQVLPAGIDWPPKPAA
jgi:hypothetical protein